MQIDLRDDKQCEARDCTNRTSAHDMLCWECSKKLRGVY